MRSNVPRAKFGEFARIRCELLTSSHATRAEHRLRIVDSPDLSVESPGGSEGRPGSVFLSTEHIGYKR